jgi:hypothetical protein
MRYSDKEINSLDRFSLPHCHCNFNSKYIKVNQIKFLMYLQEAIFFNSFVLFATRLQYTEVCPII